MEVIVQVYISNNDQQWGPFDLNQLERHGNRLPVWRPAAAQRRTWKFYAPVAVGAVCVLLLIALAWPKVVDTERLEYRDGVAYELKSDKPFEGKAVQHYPDGAIQSEGRKENGRFHGEVTYYRQNGEIKRQMTFIHGNPVGQREMPAKNGNSP